MHCFHHSDSKIFISGRNPNIGVVLPNLISVIYWAFPSCMYRMTTMIDTGHACVVDDAVSNTKKSRPMPHCVINSRTL